MGTLIIVFLVGMLAGVAATIWAFVVEARTVRRPGFIGTKRPW